MAASGSGTSTCWRIHDRRSGTRAMTRRSKIIGALRLAATVAVLAGIITFVDSQNLLDRLRGVDPLWLAAAVAVALPHYAFSALRWRYMTRVFGGDIRLRRAVPEYFLAVFLNQTLPGGVPGDIVRAWRDKGRARSAGNGAEAGGQTQGLGAAARGVVFERASGQITLVLVGLAGIALATPHMRDQMPVWLIGVIVGGVAAVVTAAMLILRLLAGRGHRRPGQVLAFLRDGRTVLFAPRHLLAHVGLSLPVVACFLGTFWLAARAIGVTLDPVLTVAVVPLVLLSMTVPVTVGGWGVREGAAAAAWAVVGLPSSQGVAISVLYGAAILASSLPGAVLLLRRGPRDEGAEGGRSSTQS